MINSIALFVNGCKAMRNFIKHFFYILIPQLLLSHSKSIWALLLFLQISVTGFAQTGIGLDCNQPIDPATGAIQPNATYAVVGTTCTPWVRVNFILGPWSSPSDQTLHSGKTWKQTYDEIIDGFVNQGIEVYGLISDQASSNPGDVLQLANSNNQAATDAWISQYVINFVDIVGHFRNRVTTYESYNEPNNWHNGMAVVHPKWFAKILQEVYMETKYYFGHDSDPSWQVTIVSGPIFTHAQDDGASYIGSTYSYGINDFDWTWILNNKGTYPLDGYGMHIYTTQGDSDPNVVIPGMNYNINAFWNSITNYEGSNSKKIWVSEFGWESNAVGYQGQADNLNTGFNLLKNDSRIALAIFFSLSDWPGASWGMYEFGNFSTSDQKLSFHAFKSQVSCPAGPTPTNLQATPDCLGNVNFNWTNSGSGWYVDVSTDPSYGTYSNNDVSNLTSTTAPSGFSPAITFLPNTTYYWRIWNGTIHTDGSSFTVPTCGSTPTNLQTTPDCSGNVTFNWTNSGTNWYVDVSTDANFSFYYNKSFSNQTSTSGPAGFVCDTYFSPCSPNSLSFQPGTTYYWRIWNGTIHTVGNSFTVPIPLAAPTITANGPLTFCQGGNVTLDAGGGYNSYSWSNGSASQTINVNSSGNYSVTVTANGCSATSSATVVVNPTPPSPTNLQVFMGCSGNVALNWNNSGNNWVLDISTDANFSFYYNKSISNQTSTAAPSGFACDIGFAPCSPGTLSFQPNTTYYWRIWNGCAHTSGNSFTVPAPLPAPTITQNGATTFCQGGSVILDAGAGYNTYSWSNGSTSQTISATSSGNYSVTVTSGSGCLATSSSTSIVVNPLPAAPTITSSGATTFCQGGSVTLDAGAGYSTYSWNNGATSQTTNVTSSNSYAVAITDGNGCSASSAVIQVTVNSLPAAPTITASGATTFCQGGSVTLDAGAGYSAYLWSDGGTTQTIGVTSSNNYSVTITDGNGCSAGSTITPVTVNPLPATPTITSSGSTTFCQGGSVTLNAGGGYSTYLWSDGATTQTVNATSSNNYSVTISGGNGCMASSSTTTVTVNPLPPVPTITQNGGVLTSSAATGNQWYLNGNLISGETLQNHTIIQVGNYSLTVTVNGCSSTSAILTIITTEVNSFSAIVESSGVISVYPNPSNGSFILKYNISYSPLKVTILNLLGEQIYFSEIITNNGELFINLPIDQSGNISDGIYFVQVLSEGKIYNKKIIVQ